MQERKPIRNVHHFAAECEEWAKLFGNKEELAKQGCDEITVQTLVALSRQLGDISFAANDLDKKELAGLVQQTRTFTDALSFGFQALYAKRAQAALLDFLAEFPAG